MLAILEALRLLLSSFQDRLLVENDSSNAISSIFNNEGSWRFHFLFVEIKSLSSQGLVKLKHGRRSANTMANSLVKQGVDRVIPLIAYTM